MQRLAVLVVTLSTALLVLAAPLTSRAYDLTGNWEGSWKCAEFADGVKTKEVNKESTAAITQLGTALGFLLDGTFDYAGIAIADVSKPDKGEAGIAHCGTDDDLSGGPFSELIRFKVSTKSSTGKGSLKGTSIWSQNGQHIASCKYKYKRIIDTLPPSVPTTCP